VLARHTLVVPATASAGHAADDPVQVSCRSQTPADARQTVTELAKPLAGQLGFTPLHVSCTSQMLAAARHTFPLRIVHAPLAVAPAAREQTWQLPPHGWSQQRPSTQEPVAHIVSRSHTLPVAICGTHARGFCVASQYAPVLQSPSTLQEPEQTVP
jgi:hypothetical protein